MSDNREWPQDDWDDLAEAKDNRMRSESPVRHYTSYPYHYIQMRVLGADGRTLGTMVVVELIPETPTPWAERHISLDAEKGRTMADPRYSADAFRKKLGEGFNYLGGGPFPDEGK